MGLPRIDKASGVVDGSNRTFFVPFPYVAGTLVGMINGRQLDGALDNGWVETSPSTGEFEFKIAPRAAGPIADDPGDLVSAYYENALEPAGGGADGGVPKIVGAGEMIPTICSADDIAPKICHAEDESEIKPAIIGAANVRPTICTTNDMRPKIAKAEVG